MQKYPWIKWLLVLLVLIVIGVALRVVLAWRDLAGIARVVDIATVALVSIWCYYGLYLRRDRLWANTQRSYLAVSNVVWVLAYIFYVSDRITWTVNVMGIWSLVAIGIFGVWLIQVVVAIGHPIAGVARTVILQATRLYVVWFVIAAVVLMLILLPGSLDPAERLNYRVSFYLVWSMRLATFMLSIMTAVLGCYTICSDLTGRQMFMLASKPVGRFQYLFGKWLGLMLLNIVLCTIVGVGVWLGARLLSQEPPPRPITQEAVNNYVITHNDVLAARVTAYPVPADVAQLGSMIKSEFDRLKAEFPGMYPDKIEDLDEARLNELRGKAIATWHTIAPLGSRAYYFDGFKPLADAYANWIARQRELKAQYDQLIAERRNDEALAVRRQAEQIPPPSQALKLRLKPKYSNNSGDGMLHMVLRISGQVMQLDPMQNDTVREIPIPLAAIDQNGRLEVMIANANVANREATHKSNIVFDPYEDIEMLYSAGTFEGNIVRGMIVHWVRLGFLAMLSITAGTMLGFPMACLTSIFVYSVAVFNSFAAESLANYTSLDLKGKSKWDVFMAVLQGIWDSIASGDFVALLKLVAKLIGDITLLIVPSFGYYNSTPLIADGRMVPVELVTESIFFVGFIASGFCLLVGWLIFRRKELARVTV